MFNLAVDYEQGKGVARDLVAARRWYGKGCGSGVAKDPAAAKEWNLKADQAGYKPACR